MDNKWVWLLLAGVGGYVAYKYWFEASSPVLVMDTGLSPKGVVSVPNAAAQITMGIEKGTISPAKLIEEAYAEGVARVVGGPELNASQWNYILNKVTGIPGQALGDDGTPMKAGAYVSLLSQWVSNQGS